MCENINLTLKKEDQEHIVIGSLHSLHVSTILWIHRSSVIYIYIYIYIYISLYIYIYIYIYI